MNSKFTGCESKIIRTNKSLQTCIISVSYWYKSIYVDWTNTGIVKLINSLRPSDAYMRQ